jgi:hypothetical protein
MGTRDTLICEHVILDGAFDPVFSDEGHVDLVIDVAFSRSGEGTVRSVRATEIHTGRTFADHEALLAVLRPSGRQQLEDILEKAVRLAWTGKTLQLCDCGKHERLSCSPGEMRSAPTSQPGRSAGARRGAGDSGRARLKIAR